MTHQQASRAQGQRPWVGRMGRPRVRALLRLSLRRLALGVPVVAGVAVAVFALAALSPFDPLRGYLDERYFTTSSEDRDSLAQSLGLDAGWWSQLLDWSAGMLGADPGWSRSFAQPVAEVVAERLPWTLLLTGTALGLAIVFSILLALACVRRPRGSLDRVVTASAHALEGIPSFLLALGAIAVVSVGLGWLPSGGLAPPGTPVTLGTTITHLALPATVLAVSTSTWLVLHLRHTLLLAMTEDHVWGARSRGLPEGVVLRHHALRGAMLPFVGLLGARLPELVTGAVLVETVFGWPGLAEATVRSALEMDFALLATLTILGTVAVLVGTWLSDCVIVLLDPRVRADA